MFIATFLRLLLIVNFVSKTIDYVNLALYDNSCPDALEFLTTRLNNISDKFYRCRQDALVSDNVLITVTSVERH
jgi:hypothetical protein